MTSKIKVDNINKVSDDSNIIKKCGTTTTIGSGASNPIVVDGSAITIGRCGGTVALASGATQSGFGSPGQLVDWQTSDIKTTTFTASNNEGYFIDTSSGAVTVNLPAGSAGNIVAFADYTRTFKINNVTIAANGSDKIGGRSNDAKLNEFGQSATFIFVDSTEGWINVDGVGSSVQGQTDFIEATGGTITTSGNDKIHTFTGPGTFCVAVVSQTTPANNEVSYMVVAGGGGGAGGETGGGGGAGGFREDKSPITPYTASPLDGAGPIFVTATGFPITVGAGGGPDNGPPANGSDSIFSTITSTGGGGGTTSTPAPGGSGGGGGRNAPGSGGSGNTPPVSPPQGNSGGSRHPGGVPNTGGGGGGATSSGQTGTNPKGGNGGNGATTEITASPVTYAGGGGGGSEGSSGGTGGPGGGGNGNPNGSPTGNPGTANTGGGGGGNGYGPSGGAASLGGSGVVVIRYKFQ